MSRSFLCVPRYHSDEEAPQPEGLDAFDLSTSSITEMLDKLRRSLRRQTADLGGNAVLVEPVHGRLPHALLQFRMRDAKVRLPCFASKSVRTKMTSSLTSAASWRRRKPSAATPLVSHISLTCDMVLSSRSAICEPSKAHELLSQKLKTMHRR